LIPKIMDNEMEHMSCRKRSDGYAAKVGRDQSRVNVHAALFRDANLAGIGTI
jgi:hypothetical protein